MTDLLRSPVCLLCGSQEAAVLIGREELEAESHYRDRLFRRRLPPDTPEDMLKDSAFATNRYDAQLVVCRQCGLVMRDPHLSPSENLRQFTRDEYSQEWLEANFERYRQVFSKRMPELSRRVGSRARVVEICTYTGGFLAAAEEWGWSTLGVDVGKAVSAFAKRKRLDVFRGTLEQARLPDHSFDAAFIWVCFDQLTDPRGTLAEISRILKDKGWLWMQVPNGGLVKLLQPLKHLGWSPLTDWTNKALAYTGLGGFPYQTGYTPRTLRMMLGSAGFEIVRVKNVANLAGSTEEKDSGLAIPEQARYRTVLQLAAQSVFAASLHTQVIGPWIEAVCRKKESS